MVSAELGNLAKAGGLADMVASLARALCGQGHDVRCALPRYRQVADRLPPTAREEHAIDVGLSLGGRQETLRVARVEDPSFPAPVLLVSHPMFDRPGIYDDPATRQGYPDNGLRWAAFCRAVHAVLGSDGWIPEVVHGHDHQAGPILGLLRWSRLPPPLFERPGLVFTIHNLEYQGNEHPTWLASSGLPPDLGRPLGPAEFHGRVNLMKLGIEAADRITTVSPRYADEIRSGPEFGAGLERVLARRAGDLVGILNGIDTVEWNPALDSHVPVRYTSASFTDKSKNRTALCREIGVEDLAGRVPLVGMVGRLTSQKGFDLLFPVLDAILGDGVPMVILGSGESRYEAALAAATRAHAPRLAVRVGFDEGLAHRIEAGADAFLMPSRYEPCGLNQMYSLRYGTVPIVRGVGGLLDTVLDVDEHPARGNGFVFRRYEPLELLATVRRAVAAFRDPASWTQLALRGMEADFSWDVPARRYAQVYRESLAPAAATEAG